MNICFIGPANSAHIAKWCDWFANHGHEVHVISFTSGNIDNARVHLIDIQVNAGGSDFQKIKYLTSGRKIKKIVTQINPDIINVHYSTSYGTAVALSGIKQYVLSVWGSDVYDFPKKSLLHKALLEFSLNKASYLFSTSKAMADEASKYSNKQFVITPFGVDMDIFNPCRRTRGEDGKFVVGTVKGLSEKYGIRNILEAVAEVTNTTDIPIVLRIAGSGPQEEEYHRLAEILGISDITTWLGYISQEEAALEWANMDVAIIPSIQESFGVSAIESQACGTPLIVSNIPGLLETTYPEHSSLVVNTNSSKEIANCIELLFRNKSLLNQMGLEGRKYVSENYEINHCFYLIEKFFLNLI